MSTLRDHLESIRIGTELAARSFPDSTEAAAHTTAVAALKLLDAAERETVSSFLDPPGTPHRVYRRIPDDPKEGAA